MGIADPAITNEAARATGLRVEGLRPHALPRASESSVVRYRDAVYRRMLATADAVSIIVALGLGAILVAGATLRPAALGLIPLVIVVPKITGLYDRDQTRLQKETLDEIPRLVSLATFVTMGAFLAGEFISTEPLD